MKFDTLDKKPKIWNIAALTAVAAAAVSALVFIGGSKTALATCAVVTVYLVAVILLLLRAFFRQLRYNPYSYNPIFYFGFAIFTFSVFVTHVILLVRIILSPEAYGIEEIALVLLHSTNNFILIIRLSAKGTDEAMKRGCFRFKNMIYYPREDSAYYRTRGGEWWG